MKKADKKNKTQLDSQKRGGYATQAISQPDERQEKTFIAQPDDDNVTRAKEWVDKGSRL